MPDASTIPDPGAFGDLSQITELIRGLFPTNVDSSEVSPAGLDAGNALLPMLMQMFQSSNFSPQQADADSADAVSRIVRQAIEGGMPGIAGAENIGGGYNTTTAGLLRNDLAVKAGEAGAARRDSTRLAYAGQKNAQGTQLIALINALTNAQRLKGQTTSNKGNAAAAGTTALLALLRSMMNSNKQNGSKGQPPSQNKPANSANKPAPSTQGEVNRDGVPSDKPYTPFEENYPDGEVPVKDPYEVDQENMGNQEVPPIDPYEVDMAGDPFDMTGDIGNGVDFTSGDFGDLSTADFGDLGDLGNLGDLTDWGDFSDIGNEDWSFLDGFGDGTGGDGGGDPWGGGFD